MALARAAASAESSLAFVLAKRGLPTAFEPCRLSSLSEPLLLFTFSGWPWFRSAAQHLICVAALQRRGGASVRFDRRCRLLCAGSMAPRCQSIGAATRPTTAALIFWGRPPTTWRQAAPLALPLPRQCHEPGLPPWACFVRRGKPSAALACVLPCPAARGQAPAGPRRV